MRFDQVDESFRQWAKDFELDVFTEYKGYEVRSADVIGGDNKKWQVWLEPSNKSKHCVVHYWNYKDIHHRKKVNNSNLLKELNRIGQKILARKVENT